MVNCALRVVEAAQPPLPPFSPPNMPFAHSSRFLCPLSSFLSVTRSRLFSRSFPPLPSIRHCFGTPTRTPHHSVGTQSAYRWISNRRGDEDSFRLGFFDLFEPLPSPNDKHTVKKLSFSLSFWKVFIKYPAASFSRSPRDIEWRDRSECIA